MAAMTTSQPTNPLVGPLLTDFYQISMAYSYWRHKRHEVEGVFELYFRQNPFGGEFTVFAGLDECIRYLESFRVTDTDIAYLRTLLPRAEPGFFDWLRALDASDVTVHAVREGTVVFPKCPLLRVHGPIGLAQLLETSLLNLVNFASLVTTNAARMRLAAGPDCRLLEFGLRRAQGPDGGVSASRYAFVGGFDGTSNVLAGKIFRDLPVSGTHGHSYVQAHRSREDLPADCILNGVDIAEAALQWRGELGYEEGAALHEGEFAAFVSYALANPTTFVALVDTYSVLDTGLRNFVTVALALAEAGFEAKGVRIDSGDLAYLSKEARQLFDRTADDLDAGTYGAGRGSLAESLRKCYVVASNDINERVLLSLRDQGAKVDAYGIGTHLVTCQAQPALGCVYKLVEISGEPCLKLSQEPGKTTIPGAKACYRLVGARGQMLLDLLVPAAHAAPEVGERVLCRHPFDSSKRAYVTPSRVLELHAPVFEGGRRVGASENLRELRAYCQRQLGEVREDVLRPLNPTPYKTSVSAELFSFLQDALQRHQPITELT
uniref:Nicotinate phosphoribosyltransferase n=1 Tax=Pelagomonas calceolata TaxID=35677 RepID=A0A7S4EAA3_9STRA